MICKSCETENPEDATVCVKCGNALEEKPVPDALPVTETQAKWKSVVELCGGIAAIAGAFFALLFSFFIGIEATVFPGIELFGNGSQKMMSWYYFYGAYRDIGNISEIATASMKASVCIEAILGTLISVGTIIAVIVLFAFTVERFAAKRKNESKTDYAPFAIAAVVVYLLGATLIYTLNAVEMGNIVVADSQLSMKNLFSMGFDGETVAGIVCACICIAVLVASRIAIKGKNLRKKQPIIRIICATTGAVLTALLLAYSAFAGFPFGDENDYISFFISFNWVNQLYSATADTVYYLSLVTELLQIVLVVLAAFALLSRLNTMFAKRHNTGLKLSVAVAVIALLYLLMGIVTILKAESSLRNYTNLIAPFLIAAINLAVSVAYSKIKSKKKKVKSSDLAD